MAQNFEEIEQASLAALEPHTEMRFFQCINGLNWLEVTVFVHEIPTWCRICLICASAGHEYIFFNPILQHNHTFYVNLDRFYNSERDLQGRFEIFGSFEVLAEFATPSLDLFAVISNSFP